jgi:hypothetical protein
MAVALHGAVRGSGLQDDGVGYAGIAERVDQHRLRQVDCNASTTGEEAEDQSIMGFGMSRSRL